MLTAVVLIVACTYILLKFRNRSRRVERPIKFSVRVTQIRDEAEDIKSFRLESETGLALAEATPGSHIGVWVRNDLVRHYSICNVKQRPQHYRIAVKLELGSRGGSERMHGLREGDLLEISEPRNNFSLIEGARKYLFFAGGIGITPILAMVQALEARGANYHLHYFTRSLEQTAFHDKLSAAQFATKVSFHHGVEPGAVRFFLLELLKKTEPGTHLYMCGPRPFMEAVEEAARLLLPSHAIHREYFSADATALEGPREEFEVEFARSGKSFLVEGGSSILEVLNDNGIKVEYSCQEGVCGTCLTSVLEGEPDHRDSFLTDNERKLGDRMLVCVSRSRSAKLVLDL